MKGVSSILLLSVALLLSACSAVGISQAQGSATSGAFSASSPAPSVPGGPLSPEAAQELSKLPAGSYVVACTPELQKLPAGMRMTQIPGFHEARPGFMLLVDGHCAMNPTATPAPTIRPISVDGS